MDGCRYAEQQDDIDGIPLPVIPFMNQARITRVEGRAFFPEAAEHLKERIRRILRVLLPLTAPVTSLCLLPILLFSQWLDPCHCRRGCRIRRSAGASP